MDLHKFSQRLERTMDSVVGALLALSLLLMLGLTLFNIIARQFQVSYLWIEPFVRHLVFLSAFLGATLATGKSHHIKLDIVSKLLETFKLKRMKYVLDLLVILVSCVACYYLFRSGFDFMQVEKEFGKEIFLGIHSSILVGIIPLGFALVGARFILVFFSKLFELNSTEQKEVA